MNEMKDERKRQPSNKGGLTQFILILPSVLIAMTSAIDNYIVRLGFQILLLVFQFVLVRNLIRDWFGDDK